MQLATIWAGLREQKAFDPVDAQHPFGDERLAFAAKPAPIFVLGRRRPDQRADARLAAFTGLLNDDDRIGLARSRKGFF